MRKDIHRKARQAALQIALTVPLLWPALAAAVTEGPFAGYFHTGWMPSDGAPAGVRAIVQDADGWLWIGSSSGLYRFDGLTFEHMDAIDGNRLHQSHISMLAYLDGALWVGYSFGGVERFKDGTATFFGADTGLPANTVERLMQAAGGPVSVLLSNGLFEYSGKHWSRTWPAPGAPTALMSDMIIGPDGALLLNSNGAVWRRKRGQSAFTRVASDAPDINSLFAAPNNGFYAASATRFLRYDAALDKLVVDPGMPRPDGDPDLDIEADGTMWAPTTHGIHLLAHGARHDVVDTMSRERGLSDGNLEAFFQDREGNVWLGTSGGIDRLRRARVQTVNVPTHMKGPGVAFDNDGQMYISGRSGAPLLRIGTDGATTQYKAMTTVETMVPDNDHGLWAANIDHLAHYVHGRETIWTLPGVSDRQPQSMAPNVDGSLWLSMISTHAISRFHDGKWETVAGWMAYPETVVLLQFDARQRLWQTYLNNRIAVSDGNTITRYTTANGLDIGNTLSLSTRAGRVWVGGDKNLMFLKGDRFFPVLDDSGKAITGIAGIVDTDEGDLWLHGSQGITHIRSDEVRRVLGGGDPRVAIERFNYEDGVIGQAPFMRPLPSLHAAPDGRIWYHTDSKIGWIDPRDVQRNARVPPVRLRALTIDGVVHQPTPDVAWRLPPRSSSLRLDYTSLTLTMPERVRFRYRLQGVDDDWVDAGTRRTAFYTNLGPGTYGFDVQAANQYGVWNTTSTHQGIVIAPTVWQTAWFRILCTGAFLATLWRLYRWRLHRLSQRMRARMDERLDERSRIARELHDTLLQSVQGLVLKIHGATQRLPVLEPVRGLLDAALTQAETTIADGRNRVQDLRTHEDGSQLVPLLKASGHAWAHDNGTEFTVAIDGAARLLSPGVGSEVLAICREAMSNAFQHAQAGHVGVDVAFGSKALSITVSDDGLGIPVDAAAHGRAGHFGLVGMRERAARLGGVLTVAPGQEGGTVCMLKLPAALAYAAGQPRWWA